MKDQITIYSRSNNDFLFERMKEFIPEGYNIVKCDQFNEWHEADDYLYHIIDTCPTRWAINIDIDCYVFKWKFIFEIIDSMRKNDINRFGMPDSVKYHPQRFHSPYSMNPFFNIFDVVKIRGQKEKDGLSWEEISQTRIGRENNEPFHGFFQWLAVDSSADLMSTQMHHDGMTTIGSNMLLHTWYSRFYGHDSPEGDYHTQRIDNVYKEALELKNKLNV